MIKIETLDYKDNKKGPTFIEWTYINNDSVKKVNIGEDVGLVLILTWLQ